MEIEIQKRLIPFNKDKLVFLVNGVEIGSIIVQHRKDYYFKTRHKLPFNKKCCYLWNFEILESYQNKGYGHQVLQYIKKQYINTSIVLDVSKENARAIHLYKSEGFKLYSGVCWDTMIFIP